MASQIHFLEVAANPASGQGLQTLQFFPTGAEVIDLQRHTDPVYAPTKYSIQVDRNQHIDGPFTRYLNHSCEPNIFVDATTWKVVSIRPLQPGEELRFFYPATEWDMVSPFACGCGSDSCLRTIAGAKHIAPNTLRHYWLNNHIEELIAELGCATLPPACSVYKDRPHCSR